MKIAILANSAPSYVKPMAEGLNRMLSRIGVESTIFYDGLEELSRLPKKFVEYVREDGSGGPNIAVGTLKYLVREAPGVYRFSKKLRSFDAIVIVNTIPKAFLRTFFRDDTLRSLLPRTPIVLYDVFYLPTRGPWGQRLKEGSPESGIPTGGHFGLERYDWYLCASVVSETPMPSGPQPYSRVGLDLDDGTLRPEEKGEFTALLDFEDPHYMRERAIQIQACEESGTKYIVLNGRYSIAEIRNLYRKVSIYLLAMRESFGLPICELQACGSYVFTPYAHWCPSHWLKADLTQEGPGECSPNVIVYDNDKTRLIQEIRRIKAAYDPQTVVDRFHDYHPQLFHGDEDQLRNFVQKIRDGAVHSLSHKDYAAIGGSGHYPSYNPDAALSRPA
jgi:hypothetical protein